MSLDKLTDDEFFKLYNGNLQIKELVDDIQKKYHAHSSQKGQPGYDPGNTAWYKEAKKAVGGIIEAQKHKAEAHQEPVHATTTRTGNYLLFGLGGLATALAAYTYPLLGAFALATTALTLYSANRPQSAQAQNKH
jgi:hypothetical protein